MPASKRADAFVFCFLPPHVNQIKGTPESRHIVNCINWEMACTNFDSMVFGRRHARPPWWTYFLAQKTAGTGRRPFEGYFADQAAPVMQMPIQKLLFAMQFGPFS